VLPGWLEHTWRQLEWTHLELLPTESDAQFDAITFEAPSSGIGLWRRKPEGKWRIDSWDIQRAARRSRELFDRAITHLSPGGILVTIVASLEPAETIGLVEWISAMHPELQLISADEHIVAPSLVQSDGTLQSFPHTHRCDSVFVALFQKQS